MKNQAFYVVAEARRLIKREVNTTKGSWVENTLKCELANGSDVFLKIGKDLNTAENIKFIENLKGKVFEAEFFISTRTFNDKEYTTYYLSSIPKILGE